MGRAVAVAVGQPGVFTWTAFRTLDGPTVSNSCTTHTTQTKSILFAQHIGSLQLRLIQSAPIDMIRCAAAGGVRLCTTCVNPNPNRNRCLMSARYYLFIIVARRGHSHCDRQRYTYEFSSDVLFPTSSYLILIIAL